MRILLFSHSYRPEPSGMGYYSGELAESLVERGYEVHVVAANPSYPHWRLFDGFGAWRWSCAVEHGVTVHRVPVFVPAKVGGVTRILHYASFCSAAIFPALKLVAWKPDAVIHVVPTLLAAPLVLTTAKLSGAKTWFHVQDFEVEAGFSTNQLNRDGHVGRWALAFERWAISAYHRTSSISAEMCRKLVEKSRKPASVYEFRNWANIASVRPQPPGGSPYRKRWDIHTPHVALYSGSISKKQGIEIIIEAARLLRHRDDITFVICGNGPERGDLERLARDLPRFQFHNLQLREQLGDLLNLATIHLLPQLAGVADLVLPSKLTNMLASGRPSVIGAAPGTGLAREGEHGGLVVEPENPRAFADAIERLAAQPELYVALGASARLRAEQAWNREAILNDFEIELRKLASPQLGKGRAKANARTPASSADAGDMRP